MNTLKHLSPRKREKIKYIRSLERENGQLSFDPLLTDTNKAVPLKKKLKPQFWE